LARLGSLLRHPLTISLIAAAFAALLLPQFTRQWQDRQKEQEIKQRLLEQISVASTTAVRQGISLVNGQVRAAGGEQGEDPAAIYAVLRNSWQIDRASARSTIITYFPEVDACWYSYERVIADFLGLVDRSPTSRRARITMIRNYVSADFAESYVEPGVAEGCASIDELPENVRTRYRELKAAMRWPALTFSTEHPRFRGVYAVLGELLLIGKERVILTIVETPAKNFDHGISLFSVRAGARR